MPARHRQGNANDDFSFVATLSPLRPLPALVFALQGPVTGGLDGDFAIHEPHVVPRAAIKPGPDGLLPNLGFWRSAQVQPLNLRGDRIASFSIRDHCRGCDCCNAACPQSTAADASVSRVRNVCRSLEGDDKDCEPALGKRQHAAAPSRDRQRATRFEKEGRLQTHQ